MRDKPLATYFEFDSILLAIKWATFFPDKALVSMVEINGSIPLV